MSTQKNTKRIQKISFFVFVIAIFAIYVFSPISLSNIAKALDGNYLKNIGDQLTIDDWNGLKNDFLDKSGDTMSGDLTLPSDPDQPMEAATKQYVDSTAVTTKSYVDSSTSAFDKLGSVYYNWGVDDCGLDQKLYGGYMFGSHYLQPHGSEVMFCLEPGDAGPASSIDMDKVSPAVIGFGVPGTSVQKEYKVECATCFRAASTCYETWGSDDCNPGAGFNPVYKGYIYGGAVENYTDDRDNNTERHCINNNFSLDTPSTAWGSVFYPTEISNSTNVPFTSDTYIKCALCCN